MLQECIEQGLYTDKPKKRFSWESRAKRDLIESLKMPSIFIRFFIEICLTLYSTIIGQIY